MSGIRRTVAMVMLTSRALIGPLCGPEREFRTRCVRPHSGPSRAERGRRRWRPAEGLRRDIKWRSSLAGVVALSAIVAAQTPATRTFATPEDAVKALVDTVKKGDVDALLAIFGPEGKELIDSSDPATARMNRDVFTVAAAEQWHLEDAPSGRKTLGIGNEQWPFPVPLVKSGAAWRFDTAAGKEEVLARRIGRNELSTIETIRAYVTAQRRYAAQGHDGKPSGIYATRFK